MHFNPALVPARDGLRAIVVKRLDWLAGQLTGPFLMGERFTVADAYLFTVLTWSKTRGIELAKWPALKAYFDRIAARPAVKEALAAEG